MHTYTTFPRYSSPGGFLADSLVKLFPNGYGMGIGTYLEYDLQVHRPSDEGPLPLRIFLILCFRPFPNRVAVTQESHTPVPLQTSTAHLNSFSAPGAHSAAYVLPRRCASQRAPKGTSSLRIDKLPTETVLWNDT